MTTNNTVEYTLSQIINRIHSMIRLSEDKANTHEAQAAINMANRLMHKYGLRPSDLGWGYNNWQGYDASYVVKDRASYKVNWGESSEKAEEPQAEEPKAEETKKESFSLERFDYIYEDGKYMILMRGSYYAPKGRKWFAKSEKAAQGYCNKLNKEYGF